LCATYLRIVAMAAPASAVLLAGAACMRGAGDTRTPFAIMVAVNLVNAAASIALVHGPAPLGGHGVGGIAAGTVIAWGLGMILTLDVLGRGRTTLRLRARRLRPHPHTMKRIARVGIPNLLEVVGGTWFATFLVLLVVGRLEGEGVIGAHMIAVRVESFSFQPGFAIGVAAATLTGQYLGVGNAAEARRAVTLCWALGAGLMGALGLVFLAIPGLLASLLTHAPRLIEQATTPIRICGLIQVFFATYIVIAQALRGAGDTRATMGMTYLTVFTIRVPGAVVFGHVLGGGLPGVWAALCLELAARGGLFAARFFHGGWAQGRV
jgi:putative MATE family efflux protein